jgi:hypothetical protein
MRINLSGITVALKEPTKHTDSTHPQNFAAETRFRSTASFTDTSVTAFPLGFKLGEEKKRDKTKRQM